MAEGDGDEEEGVQETNGNTLDNRSLRDEFKALLQLAAPTILQTASQQVGLGLVDHHSMRC
jgi:hypothetical protein